MQRLDKGENDLILLGDFNRDGPTHGAFDPLENLDLVQVIETEQETYTTYSTSLTDPAGNWYDQMWIGRTTMQEDLSGTLGVYELHAYFFPDAEHPHLEVRTEISDHLPIWAEFYTDRDTDRPEETAACADIRISSVNPEEESFSIINETDTPICLAGYSVTDNEGVYTFPQSTWLQPGENLTVCFSDYNPKGNTRGLYLNNEGDELLIFGPGATEPLDSWQWEDGATPARYGSE